LNFTLGVFNKSASSAPLLAKKDSKGKFILHAASSGFKFEAFDFRFNSSGYINYDFSMTESIIET
jgi:hypothetical protein